VDLFEKLRTSDDLAVLFNDTLGSKSVASVTRTRQYLRFAVNGWTVVFEGHPILTAVVLIPDFLKRRWWVSRY
jgi:hypothetical protein